MKIFIFIFFFSLKSASSEAVDAFQKIKGCFCEGGVIIGKANNSDSVLIDGQVQKISKDGFYIFAFGRDYPKTVLIKINNKTKTFEIRQKKYKIERINNLPSNKVQPSEKEIKRIIKEQKSIQTAKKMGFDNKISNGNFVLPFDGRISGVFGSQRILNKIPKRPHYGLDIAAPIGTEIFAPNNGIVKLVGADLFYTGNTLILDHGLGMISIYAHMNEISVKKGQKIALGQLLGSVGKTGRATGPHLHWGVYLLNKPIDPMSLVKSEFY